MMSIKTEDDIRILREGGKRLATILHTVAEEVKAGVVAAYLNELAERLIKEGGDTPSFLGYKPKGARRPFPAALCVSVNDEVVHGIPNEAEKILREGDIVALDAGLIHNGLYTDMAITVGVGVIDEKAQKLLEVTKKSLALGIKEIKAGATTGDIGAAIQKFVEPYGFGIVRDLAGHGVGYGVHEDPFIPNFGTKGEGVELKTGMVIAIEPMLNEGSAEVRLDSDGYTYRTQDGSRSAHFEATIVVTEKGSEILTQM